MELTVEQVTKYGFDLYEKERDPYEKEEHLIELFPETVIQEPPWLILTRYWDVHIFEGYQIVAHRTDELTSKYKGQRVSARWVIKFCSHNEERARMKTAHNLEESKKEKEALEKKEKELNNPALLAERQRLKKEEHGHMIENYKTKRTGFRAGANLCPVCNGDGGVRKCYKCEGTGWV